MFRMQAMPIRPALLALGLSFASGCATAPYLQDRGRDAADVFSVTVGYGVGIRTQVGPLATSIGLIKDVAGVMSGSALWSTSASPMSIGTLYLDFVDGNNRTDTTRLRKKRYEQAHFAFLPFAYCEPSFPYFNPNECHYLTKLELAAGLGPSLRIAFNPVEFADFLLGLFTIDLFGDDISGHPETEP